MSFYASLPDPTPSDFKFYSFFTRFGQERADLTRINFRFTIRSSADRHVRRLLLSVEERGDAAVIHGLRGQPSNRKLATALEQKILARVRQRYADFGPTLASEHLAKDELLVSRKTLRKWMAKEALWRPRRQRVKTVQVWRERRASFGELVMQDSSLFCWFEERGPACQLIAMIDDATSRVWARFVEHDSREENRRTLWGWLRRYGRLWRRITPIKTASFAAPARPRWANSCEEKRRARSSGVR
jgi:hypothetical protein